MRRPWLRFLLVVFACAVSGSVAAAEPLKVRIGYSDAAMHLTPVLFTRPDILKHYGKSYVVDVLAFQGGAPQVTAIAANQLDIAAIAFPLLSLAVKRANLDVRVVADTVQSSVPGYADMLFVAKKGRFKSPADLKGATIALNALGSGIDAANREFLERAGLKIDRDYRFVEVRFSGMLAALETGRVDVGSLAPPYSFDAEATGKYETIYTLGDLIGPNQAVMWIARKDWLDANKAALLDFFEDFLRARRWMMAEANHAEAVKMVAAVTKRSPDDYKSWLLTKRDWFRDPNGVPSIDMIQRNIDQAVKIGTLPAAVNVRDYVDLSFLEAARKRIESQP